MKLVARVRYNRLFKDGRLQMLFIVGTMRSGSTLLLHILNSNPAIVGYGETHTSYRSRADFAVVTQNVLSSFHRKLTDERYVLDKVLHNGHIDDPEIIRGSKVIFMTRPPEESLPSIATVERFAGFPPERTLNYWTRRLEWMANAARSLDPNDWIHVTYAQLVTEPEATFRRIEKLLDLRTPLTETYEKTWATGRGNIGDPSEAIRSGTIVKTQPKELTEEMRSILEPARASYDECIRVLTERGST